MNRLVVLATLLLLAPGIAHADDVPRGFDLLDAWRFEEAEQLAARLTSEAPGDPSVAVLRGSVLFHQGDYAGAALELRAAEGRVGAGPRERYAREMIEIAEATRTATEGFVEVVSPSGRFLVRHAPGRDAILVPYVGDALDRAYHALAEDLGYAPPGRIVVEIYPSPRTLAQVSSLTEDEIEASGTIALCKWGRLMITSPRALVHGYPWLDTLNHELTHLFVSRLTHDRTPIWLHEGFAKFEERRWREPPGGRLPPSQAHLLDRAVRNNTLIPFRRLHPSIAKLPTQEQAALAFAQVYTFVRMLHGRIGYAGLRDVFGAIRDGADAMDAVAHATDASFDGLLAAWRSQLASGSAPPRVATIFRRRFRQEGDEGDSDETRDVGEARARRATRLGDMLWERGRARAAAIEYAKAAAAAPDDPIVANRLARARLASDDAAGALDALRGVSDLYPEYAATYVNRGTALLARGDATAAAGSFVEAVRIDPFDPAPHCALARIAGDRGDASQADVERRACSALQGR